MAYHVPPGECTVASMTSRFPQELDLEARFPAFEVWVVRKAVGGLWWCARRRGADLAEFQAATSVELGADLDTAAVRHEEESAR